MSSTMSVCEARQLESSCWEFLSEGILAWNFLGPEIGSHQPTWMEKVLLLEKSHRRTAQRVRKKHATFQNPPSRAMFRVFRLSMNFCCLKTIVEIKSYSSEVEY